MRNRRDSLSINSEEKFRELVEWGERWEPSNNNSPHEEKEKSALKKIWGGGINIDLSTTRQGGLGWGEGKLARV